ncbi:GntR family transcriptional regulator [Streptomyces sp. NBC_01546]|uniref:GntR family transcriptional regulator n=1 Tax=Streptomyces sp. NBC_01546 TaxID=2975872 RepID=UPI00386399BC
MDRSAPRAWSPAELDCVLGGWTAGPGPLYRRLAAALHHAVRTGELAPGDRLPAERTLAAALGLSRATVVCAYDELRGAGAVDSRRGAAPGSPGCRAPRSGRPTGGSPAAPLRPWSSGWWTTARPR